MNNQLSVDPNIRFGKACIPGTRISLSDIIYLFQSGYSLEDIPKQYPHITLQQVKEALSCVSNVLGNEESFEVIKS